MASVDSTLRALYAATSAAESYEALRGALVDAAGTLVGASAWALYLLDEDLRPRDVAALGVPSAFLDRYEELGRSVDPVMGTVLDAHAPSHNLHGRDLEAWHREPLYQHVCSRFELEHILTAPVVGNGRLVGTFNFARGPGELPFDATDLQRATALGAHTSALLARLRLPVSVPDLTRRELQIARLVAKGLNNREIATCLSISRNTVKAVLKRLFDKLGVQARAEMVAQLMAAAVI